MDFALTPLTSNSIVEFGINIWSHTHKHSLHMQALTHLRGNIQRQASMLRFYKSLLDERQTQPYRTLAQRSWHP